MYKKYMIVCEVFSYFIFGKYFYLSILERPTPAAGPTNKKKKKEKIIKKK